MMEKTSISTKTWHVKAVGLALAALAIVVAMTCSATAAYANFTPHPRQGAYTPHISEVFSGTMKVSYPGEWNYNKFNFMAEKKITLLKNSNKKVASVKARGDEYSGALTIKTKKPGKAKISYKFKGKKHTFKLVVYKYVNPFKKFEIGTKNYASKFDKKGTAKTKVELKGKLNVRLKGKFELKGIEVNGGKVKNGTELTSDDEVMSVDVKAKNKKTGFVEWVHLETSYGW